MMGERRMFIFFEKNECESDCIMFGDNSQGQVIDFGKIAITTEHLIFKVLLVESLDYNLLSVSQLYEMGYNYLFSNNGVTVFRRSDSSFAFKGVLRGKLYLVYFIPEEVELERCLIVKTNMGWLWYRWLAHVFSPIARFQRGWSDMSGPQPGHVQPNQIFSATKSQTRHI
jgi:hypothetical protein